MFTSILLVLVISVIFALLAIQPRGARTLFDPGVLVVAFFSLCYLAPSIIFMENNIGLTYDHFAVVETISLYGILFTLSFFISYVFFGKIPVLRIHGNYYKASGFDPAVYFVLFIFIYSVQNILFFIYGVGEASTYTEQYALRASMPTYVSQLVNFMGWFKHILLCFFMASSLSRELDKKHIVLLLFLAFFLFVDMLVTQSRNQIVVLFLLFIGTYNLYRMHMGIVKEAIISLILILGMSLFALIRAGTWDGNLINVLVPSEFISIYRNAFHLVTIADEVVRPPGVSYIQAFISFIPQQLNEGKWDLASWYVSTYYPDYYRSGGGLAFGVIPEALVNFGYVSIIFQAFVIAAILKITHCLANKKRFFGINSWVIFYLFCYSLIYQLIRSNSFVIISGLVTGFIIPYLVISTIGRFRLEPVKR